MENDIMRFFSRKKLIPMCCGNCNEFETGKEPFGFCPAIYWKYNVSKTHRNFWCRHFELRINLSKTYKVNKKSRKPETDLITIFKEKSIAEQPAMINDSVMLFG